MRGDIDTECVCERPRVFSTIAQRCAADGLKCGVGNDGGVVEPRFRHGDGYRVGWATEGAHDMSRVMREKRKVDGGGKGLYTWRDMRLRMRVRVWSRDAMLMYRGPAPAHRSITLARRKVVARALEQPHRILDAIPELIDALWLVAIIAHRPTQRLDPVLHDLRGPLDTVELGAVAEHGDNVRRVFLLVSDELEGDAPEHGDADEDQTGR